MSPSTAPAPADTTPDRFESIYAEARGDTALIPWEDGRANPALVNWLNSIAPSLVRCGARVAVVGCGLGNDARELIRRGYEVTAFDCAPTAIAWAQRIDPANADRYVVADLFRPLPRWRHRFDLVVEVNTLQALHPSLRLGAMSAMADLVSRRGRLLTVCRAAETPVPIDAGPPWALTPAELREGTALAGLAPEGEICVFDDNETPPVRRMRGVFMRS